MEYLTVLFPDERDVVASGNTVGFTNSIIALEPDYYVITLDGVNTRPAKWYGILSGTSVSRPMVIAFEAADPPRDPRRRPQRARARRGGRPDRRHQS
jgi:hypothetical protein